MFVVATLKDTRSKQDPKRLLIEELDVPVHAVMVAHVGYRGARIFRLDPNHSSHERMAVSTWRLDIEKITVVEDGIGFDTPSDAPYLGEFIEDRLRPIIRSRLGRVVRDMDVGTRYKTDTAHSQIYPGVLWSPSYRWLSLRASERSTISK